MPAATALTIADGQASPVNHTFSMAAQSGTSFQWKDRSPATPAGARVLNYEVLAPAGQRTVHKVNVGVYNPTEALVDGSTVVVRSCSAQVSLNFPPEATLQERKDTLAYLSNALANAAVKGAIQEIEPFW